MDRSRILFLAGTVFLMISLSPSVAEDCGTDWFGSKCRYKCRCGLNSNSCDNDGKCLGVSTCASGWFGPECQYVNVMASKSITAPAWLLNEHSCNQNQSSESVTITSSTAFPFTWVRLGVNDSGLLRNFTIRFNNGTVDCGIMRAAMVNSMTLDIYCDVNVLVDSVILTGEGVTALCSVSISGGRSVGLRQSTTQSSTEKGGYSSASSNAVDGNTDGDYNKGSCSHTEDDGTDTNSTWTVRFSQAQMINRYILFNRLYVTNSPGCCRERLQGFVLKSVAEGGSTVFEHRDPGLGPEDNYTVTSVDKTSPISSVSITATYTNTFYSYTKTPVLTLCEVELYGDSDCPKGEYGRECEQQCNCAVDESCLVSTGGCPSGCAAGYYGEDCKTICPPKSYGEDCNNNCSTACEDQLCNATTGICNTCPVGKTGAKCEEDCPPTYYGKDCTERCSSNCSNQECNAVYGNCTLCPPGRKGPFCAEVCPPSSYGKGCNQNCSTKCKDQLCNETTGFCNTCPVGKTGKQCEQDCLAGTYGPMCRENCSKNCGGDGSCHSVNGTCSNGCLNGYTGLMCNKSCDPGKYGKDCSEYCSDFCNTTMANASPCNYINGTCLRGCVTGYKEPLCVTVAGATFGDDNGPSPELGAIIGAVAAAVVVVAFVVAGIIFWRRRASSKNNILAGTYANEGINAHTRDESNTGLSEPDVDEEQVWANPARQSNAAETASTAELVMDNCQQTRAPKPAVKPKPPGKPLFGLKPKKGEATPRAGGKSGVYYNTLKDLNTSTVVPIDELDTFMASHNKDFFKEQFNSIPANENATTIIGLHDKNKQKNRYKNICAYDHSRVHLEISEAKNHGDYINASYIEGYKNEEKFIASQGPTKLILEDFIRMMWEQRIDKVVMLTNLVEEGKQKCERYWPEDDDIELGEIKVTLMTSDVFADYTIRRLQLSKKIGEPVRTLTQFHFTSWPDKGVPTLAWGLVDFEQRVASLPTNRPIVVHCSAGVGRTGTFIALRNVMKEAEDTDQIDFFATVQKLRGDRMNMVQTAEQYEFLHRAAQVAIVCMGTTVTSSDIQQRIAKLEQSSSSGQSNMEKEFKAICNVCDDEADSSNEDDTGESVENVYQNSRSVGNKLKNRLSNILPKEHYRANLVCESDDFGNYINAVVVPSFKKQDQNILTQLPLPTTVTDFWRLVFQRKVSLIVAFELDLKAADSTIGEYLPSNEDEPLIAGMYNISAQPPSQDECGEVQKIIITTDAERKTRKSTQMGLEGELRLTHFKIRTTDFNPDTLLNVIREIRSRSSDDAERTVYMCRNGADYSGLVCVLSLLLDRMDNDQRLTVPLVVGAIKSIRPQVIPTLTQYRLLYQVLKRYSETSNVYSNFGDTSSSATGSNANTRI